MKTTTKNRTVALLEGAIMVALAVILEMLLPIWQMPEGGAITVAVIPIVFYSYRRGALMGILTGFVWSVTQLLVGKFYVPPANTLWAIILCLLLDYLIAFTVAGLAIVFAKPFKKYRLVGYSVGAAVICLLRYLSSTLSGVFLWGSYAPEGMNVWWYSITYNGSYMIPNMLIAAIVLPLLCMAVDPQTLRPIKRNK